MKASLPFRAWFYLRTGYAVYLSFILAAVNVIVTVYYLAIENNQTLKLIFPDFSYWAVTIVVIGVPAAVFIGWLHLKRSPAYRSELDVSVEANPYYYKLPPGYWRDALVPVLLETMKLNIKLLKKESLTDGEIDSLQGLQEKLQHLIDGGRIDSKSKNLPGS